MKRLCSVASDDECLRICLVTMTTFLRNTTLSRSRRYKYEALGAPSSGKDHILKSISYRRRRAKQRKIFLTTYKLDSFTEPTSPKLNKVVALKLKKIVASVLKLMHTTAGSFRSKSSSLSTHF